MATIGVEIRVPKKLHSIMRKLVKEGYFTKYSDIVNAALFEYYKANGFFESTEVSPGTEEVEEEELE